MLKTWHLVEKQCWRLTKDTKSGVKIDNILLESFQELYDSLKLPSCSWIRKQNNVLIPNIGNSNTKYVSRYRIYMSYFCHFFIPYHILLNSNKISKQKLLQLLIIFVFWQVGQNFLFLLQMKWYFSGLAFIYLL